ncbi:MAG: sulfite exporter TauE/SafE family protein [Gemmatimonadales bacterium]|nr:sulfite exporter TauE/SafE family protein [Gemmatimonadales bacterium]
MAHWTSYIILVAVGFAAGALNVIAAGGSLLTLPVLIFLGLPPTVANGTNRVAILVQNVGAVWSFHRHRVIDWRWIPRAGVPAALGAVLGAWLAIRIGDDAFRRILAGVIIAAAAWTLWDPLQRRRPAPGTESQHWGPGFALIFFGIGVYGGFVQAGVGFLVLAAVTILGLDFVRGNALKVLIALLFTPLALVVFSLSGKVDWVAGAALALGNLLGGLIGVRLSVLKGHRWIRRVVMVTVVIFAIRLWMAP